MYFPRYNCDKTPTSSKEIELSKAKEQANATKSIVTISAKTGAME